MLSEGRGDGSELAEACCAVVRTRGARLLPEFGHAQIALRLVVGEGDVEVREKEQDPVLALSENRPGKNRPVANGETVAC